MHRKISPNIKWIVGIDEVGRGPIAGPVTVGVCVCSADEYVQLCSDHPNIADSKKITPKKRLRIAEELNKEQRLRSSIASSTAVDIDTIGIVPALLQALDEALNQLGLDPSEILVLLDGGLKAPKKYFHQETIIKGDQSEWLIGAASIVAKVHRDNKMIAYAKEYPLYGFEKHKGYGTKAHYQALREHGTSALHRTSFLRNL